MNMHPFKTLCVGIGDPINKSLGPVIHNAGLKSAGQDDKFLYISMNVSSVMLAQFMDFAKTSNIRGITVTLPHKEAVIHLLDRVDETARQIGAVNTVINDGAILTGFNTDYIGAVEPLKKLADLNDKNIAVIGAGGAAKAFAYGLIQESARVTIFNRTIEKADILAKKFGCESAGLDEISKVKDFDIICNASAIGFSGSSKADISPVPKEFIKSNHIVFDAVYSPLETKLLQYAREAGAKAINGTEMLLHQGYAQFNLYYEIEAPRSDMKKTLLEYLKNEK